MERAVAKLQAMGELRGNKHAANGVTSHLSMDGWGGSTLGGAALPPPEMDTRPPNQVPESSAQPRQDQNKDEEVNEVEQQTPHTF